MKHNWIKKTAYRALAMLLVVTTLGANMTTLSYAKVDDGEEEETYCGLTAHTHEEGICWVEVPELICEIEEGYVHQHEETCYRVKPVLLCEDEECEPHFHDETCLREVRKNVCGEAEHEAHTHDESCYKTVSELGCGQVAREAHFHGEDCYAMVSVVTCGETEHEAHFHGEDCYTVEPVRICGETEHEAHFHGEDCYGMESVCICGETEHEAHFHGEDCYAMESVRVCGEKEYEAHTHGEECYTTESELTCEDESEEHIHGEDCYTEKETLDCSLREGEGHAHDDTCYEEQEKLVCKTKETEGHAHDETCYEEQEKLTCRKKETEGHTHDETCYEEQEKLTCRTEESEGHAHDETCYEEQEKLTCRKKETEGHAHDETCYREKQQLSCGEEETEGHTHDEDCFVTEPAVACGKKETEGHAHGEECYEEQNTLICRKSMEPHEHDEDDCYKMKKEFLCELEEHEHTEECYVPEDPDIGTFCGIPAHEHTQSCYTTTQRLTCKIEEGDIHYHGDGCYTEKKELDCGLKAQKAHAHGEDCYTEKETLTCGETERDGHTHGDACYHEEDGRLVCYLPEEEGHAHSGDCYTVDSVLTCAKQETEGHAHGADCYVLKEQLTCTMEEGVPHVHGKKCYTANQRLTCAVKEHTHTEECYIELVPQELTAEDGVDSVIVSGDFPAGAEMELEAVALTEEEILAIAKKLPEIDPDGIYFAYDITIYADGEEYQPKKPVSVSVVRGASAFSRKQPEITVQHIIKKGSKYQAETVPSTQRGSTVTFSAESFSIYIGTVMKYSAGLQLLAGEGYDFYDEDDNLLSADDQIVWESELVIKVKPKADYAITGVTVLDEEDNDGEATVTENDGVYTVTFGEPTADSKNQIIDVKCRKVSGVVYFDLAAGNVTITNNTYTGYVYRYGTNTVETVTGTFSENLRYYVYQSSASTRDESGKKTDGTVVLPEYDEPRYDGKRWSNYITNNTNPLEVYNAWPAVAASVGRDSTDKKITIEVAGKKCDLTIDDVWTTNNSYSSDGAISISKANTSRTKVTIRLEGDNVMRRIYYYTSVNNGTVGSSNGSSLTFCSADGTVGKTSGSLTVIGNPSRDIGNENYVGDKVSRNNWHSVIGGSDSYDNTFGLIINSGTIYAGSATDFENCTAIGGGGNGTGEVTINGGRVTAVSNTTGTAIGGGIAHTGVGGIGLVTINDGSVYAYNYGVRAYAVVDKYGSATAQQIDDARHIAGTAIGGASSIMAKGNDGTVTINGGYVYAESLGGSALGGGNSVTNNAGTATITINDGTVIAKSTEYQNYTTRKNGSPYHINAGAAIGGGTGGGTGNGGNATVKINGGTLETGSIGGGSTTSTDPTYKIGAADVTITGGTVSGQVVMAGGAGKSCSFTMSGGTLSAPKSGYLTFVTKTAGNGGVVWMDDAGGVATISGDALIENASAQKGGAIYMTAGTVTMSGGTIRNTTAAESGGAVYMEGGTVTMSGGTIEECSAAQSGGAIYMIAGTLNMRGGTIQNTAANQSGGAVYMGGGTMTVNSGSIQQCSAPQSGGGIYMVAGKMFLQGGAIQDCSTTQSGGGIYMGGGELHISGGKLNGNTATVNGGGACLENGSVIMSGGEVSGNTATTGAGGGIYASALTTDVTVDIFSGTISNNTAKTHGGALAVVGQSAERSVAVTLGLNEPHFYANGDEIPRENITHSKTIGGMTYNYTHLTCPVISENSVPAESTGGAVYVTGVGAPEKALLTFYCTMAENNKVGAGGDRSDFMMVESGKVIISTAYESTGNDTPEGDNKHGDTLILGNIYVVGGEMDLYGSMSNPSLEDYWITVDILDPTTGYFSDNRYNDDVYYTITYFENFMESGQYTSMQILKDELHEIMGALYPHEGYELTGWYPADRSDGRYNVGDKYRFDGQIWRVTPEGDILAKGGDADGNLELYAEWKSFGYIVNFDANVESGVTVGGEEMLPQSIPYGMDTALNENTYQYKGYMLEGWTLDRANLGTVYADGAVVRDLPLQPGGGYTVMEDGVTVTLYAKWVECEHDPDEVEFTYKVVDGGTALQRECECGGQRLKASLSASDAVYDGDPHGAKLTCTDASLWKPEISYYDEDDEELDGRPVDAGIYTAVISGRDANGTKQASVEFEIEKAPQDPPEEDEISFTVDTENERLMVTPVSDSSKADEDPLIKTMYQLFYYEGTEPKSSNVLTEDDVLVFDLKKAYTNYYLKVWYSEGKNHKESKKTASEAKFYKGKTEIIVHAEDGIEFFMQDLDTEGVKIIAWADDAHYLTSAFAIVDDNAYTDLTLPTDGSDGTKYSTMTDIPNSGVVTVTITGVRGKSSVTGTVKEKQVFGSVKNTTAVVSRDSAYTARYEVKSYDSTVYNGFALKFFENSNPVTLPAGTTIILQDRTVGQNGTLAEPTYWYVDAGGKSEISLGEFDEMGGTGGWSHGTRADMNLQFVVDFSRTASGCSGSELDTTLELVKRSGADTAAPDVEATVFVELENSATFTLTTEADATGLAQVITYSYVPSAAAASKWDGRDAAIVLDLPADIPPDLVIKVSSSAGTSWDRPVEGSRVIIPVGSLSSGTLTTSWLSNLLPEGGKDYTVSVSWYAADSLAEESPMKGTLLKSVDAEFTVAGVAQYGLKVTSGDRIVDDGILNIQLDWDGSVLGDGSPVDVKASVQFMNSNGAYSNTGQEVFIEKEGSHAIGVNYDNGSYRLLFEVTDKTTMEKVITMTYYFLINKE